MSVLLPILYLILLLLQLLLLILNIRKPLKKRWILLFVAEAISETAAILLMDPGIMPGIIYFAETMYSLAAAVVYGGMLLLSVIMMTALMLRKKENK